MDAVGIVARAGNHVAYVCGADGVACDPVESDFAVRRGAAGRDAGGAGRIVETRSAGRGVVRCQEVDEGTVQIGLRGRVIEAKSQIQSQTAAHLPVVLRIPLDVVVLGVERHGICVLVVARGLSQKSQRVAGTGVEGRSRTGGGEAEGARILVVGGLNLVIEFDVGAELEGVMALHLADVVLIGMDRVEVLVGAGIRAVRA